MLTEPLPPADVNDCDVEARAKLHAYTKVFDGGLNWDPADVTVITRVTQSVFGCGQVENTLVMSTRMRPSACGVGVPMFTTMNGSIALA